MVWYLSAPHQAIYNALTESKNLKEIESAADTTEKVTTKALAKLIQVGLVVEDSGQYDRANSLVEGESDTVGSYA